MRIDEGIAPLVDQGGDEVIAEIRGEQADDKKNAPRAVVRGNERYQVQAGEQELGGSVKYDRRLFSVSDPAHNEYGKYLKQE